MSVKIPAKAIAIAALESAVALDELVADVFDYEKKSHARLLAITAIMRFYPNAQREAVCQCFGVPLRIDMRYPLRNMVCAKWFDERDMLRVMGAIEKCVRHPPGVTWLTKPAEDDGPIVDVRERAGPGRPGPRLPAAARPPRPANVTAQLLGDPAARVARPPTAEEIERMRRPVPKSRRRIVSEFQDA